MVIFSKATIVESIRIFHNESTVIRVYALILYIVREENLGTKQV